MARFLYSLKLWFRNKSNLSTVQDVLLLSAVGCVLVVSASFGFRVFFSSVAVICFTAALFLERYDRSS